MDIDTEIALTIMRGGFREHEPYIPTAEQEAWLNTQHTEFDTLTAEFPLQLGMDTSNEYAEKLDDGEAKTSLTYGEIDFQSLARLILTLRERYHLQPGGVFCDLGSGTGKAVVAAALAHGFDECRGIELLECLHDIALKLQTVYEAAHSTPKVAFQLGDLLTTDWSDARVIFVNGTCMGQEVVEQIGSMPVALGTLSLCLTNNLPSIHWKILEKVKQQMSWGEATVFIQEKVDPEEQERLLKEFGQALNSD